jgi:hypothetical protein
MPLPKHLRLDLFVDPDDVPPPKSGTPKASSSSASSTDVPSSPLVVNQSSDPVAQLILKHNISKITPTLYISGHEVINDVTLLKTLGINSLINCCALRDVSHLSKSMGFRHLQLGLQDDMSEDLISSKNEQHQARDSRTGGVLERVCRYMLQGKGGDGSVRETRSRRTSSVTSVQSNDDSYDDSDDFNDDCSYKNGSVGSIDGVEDLNPSLPPSANTSPRHEKAGGDQHQNVVLIHCNAGMSRSCTLAIAYLMFSEKLSLLDSFMLVKANRPQASPNPNFMAQLCIFEKVVFRLKGEDDGSLDMDLFRSDRFGDVESFRKNKGGKHVDGRGAVEEGKAHDRQDDDDEGRSESKDARDDDETGGDEAKRR